MKSSPKDAPAQPGAVSAREKRFKIFSWIITLLLATLMVLATILRPKEVQSSPTTGALIPTLTATQPANTQDVPLPDLNLSLADDAVKRDINVHTISPTRPRETVMDYAITTGDSIFAIAQKFNIKPESVLWANYDTLADNPDMISPGQTLKIPPTNGILYQWKEGDTLEQVAARFRAKADDILSWPGNKLDLTNPQVQAGELVMIPNGWREIKPWVIPTIPRGPAGVLMTILGNGACDTSAGGAFGTGHFIWPASTHRLSGNDYWSGHLGIDIAAFQGTPIGAADGGLVVYSGWAYGGYGNMVMIDHGNGFQTLYAHMISTLVRCGQSVGQGQSIGQAGSTGNSTGAHLHFELRYMGGFVNPWNYLP